MPSGHPCIPIEIVLDQWTLCVLRLSSKRYWAFLLAGLEFAVKFSSLPHFLMSCRSIVMLQNLSTRLLTVSFSFHFNFIQRTYIAHLQDNLLRGDPGFWFVLSVEF